MRDKKLDDLAPDFKLLAVELLARLVETGILVCIVETLRTEAQHQEDLASGHSWVTHSKHQDGLAIDICPFSVWTEKGEDKLQWDASDPIWARIGEIGKKLGLTWGGDWEVRDMGHFEL
jgi:peptidoglycan L-alanyl-D-glutamate endopeptidase CwlK